MKIMTIDSIALESVTGGYEMPCQSLQNAKLPFNSISRAQAAQIANCKGVTSYQLDQLKHIEYLQQKK